MNTHSLGLMPPLLTSTKPSATIDSVTFSAKVSTRDKRHEIVFKRYMH